MLMGLIWARKKAEENFGSSGNLKADRGEIEWKMGG